MNSGILSVVSNETIGRLGAGNFTQTGGTHEVGNTITIHAKGTYNLAGGTLSAATIAFNGGGVFSFTGGTLAVGFFGWELCQCRGYAGARRIAWRHHDMGRLYAVCHQCFFCRIGGLIAGTQYDQLNVDGTAVLDGKLQVSLYGQFCSAGRFLFRHPDCGGYPGESLFPSSPLL